MTVKTIETRAVVSAEDRTGAVFRAVEQRLKHMEGTAVQAGQKVRAATWVAQQAAEKSRRASAAAAAAAPATAVFGAKGAALQFIGGALLTALSASSIRGIAEAVAGRLSVKTDARLAGLSEAEISRLDVRAAGLKRRHPGLSHEESFNLLREMPTILGPQAGDKEADTIASLGELLKQKKMRPEALTSFMRGAAIAGLTSSPEKFEKAADAFAKAVTVFGDSVKPEDYFAAIQGSRGAAAGFSQRFLAGPMMSLSQDMSGSGTGAALSSLYSAIAGGRMTNEALLEFHKLGLVNAADVSRGKAGQLKFAPSARITGSDQFRSDPDLYFEKILQPALERHGIKGEAGQQAWLARAFSDSRARYAAGILLHQRKRFAQDWEAIDKSPGLSGISAARRSDAGLQFQELGGAAKGAITSSVESLTGNTGALNSLTDTLNRASEGIQKENAKGIFGPWSTLGAAAIGEAGLAGLWAVSKTIGAQGAAKALGFGMRAFPATAGVYAAYQVLEPSPAGAADNELQRQEHMRRKGMLNPAPISAMAPDMQAVKPFAGMLEIPKQKVEAKLEGEANLKVDMSFRIDDALILERLDKRTSNSMGISMKPDR